MSKSVSKKVRLSVAERKYLNRDIATLSVTKKSRPSVAERKYLECEIAITCWENYSRRCGVTPRHVVDELDWLYRWHPEYRARVSDLYDRMAKLFESRTFDYFDYEPWEI